MTLPSTTRRNDYVGNGAASSYPYTFKIFSKNDLKVTKRDTSNVETLLVVDTDYTVSGVGDSDGGSITLAAGNLPASYHLTIRRARTLEQNTDVRNQGDFFPEIHEDAFDDLAMKIQSLKDEIDRALKFPETVTGVAVELPVPVGNRYFFMNEGGDAVMLVEALDTTPNPMSAKGDLLTRETGGNSRLAVGANDEILVADSTQAKGMKWSNRFASEHNADGTHKYKGELDLREFLPVGFVTDGSVDYSTEVQACITAGKRIFIPAGTWLCENLNVRGWRNIRGAGRANTALKIPAASTGWLINSSDGATGNWMPYSTITDLSIDGSNSTSALGAIYAQFITRWEFERVEIYGFYGTTAVGMKLDHAYQVAFRDCYVRMGSAGAGKKGTACFQVGASTSDIIHTTHISFDNCLAQYSGTGFFLSALGAVGDEFTIRQCAAGNHDYGIRVQDNYRSVRVENTLIENTSINGVRVTTATPLNIKGVTLDAVRLYENTIGVYTDQVEELRLHQLQFKGDDAGGHTMFSLNNTQRITFGPYTNEGTAYNTVVAGGSTDPRVTNLFQNDTTPTVAVGGRRHTFKTNNSSPTTISMFDDGVTGQEITIIFNDANTTIDFTGTNLYGNGGADFVAAAGDVMTGVFGGTNWFFQVHDNTP